MGGDFGSKPIFHHNQTEDLTVHFAVVNDGHSTIHPGIQSSHLLINGVEPVDWPMVLGNRLRAGREVNGVFVTNWDSLAPGEEVEFTYQLGRYFAKPGVYVLRWKGKHFRAPEITFRVLPLTPER